MGRYEQIHLDVLFASVGRSVWYVQMTEDALCNALTVVESVKTLRDRTLEEVLAALAQHRKSTFGTSLRRARECGAFSPALINQLSDLKNERDWLCHRIVPQNADDLYDDARFHDLISRVLKVATCAKELQIHIASILESYIVALGVDREWIEQHTSALIRRLEGEPV